MGPASWVRLKMLLLIFTISQPFTILCLWLGPGQYDPRVKTEKGNLMTVHDARFPKPPDTGVPGPGAYTVCTDLTSYCCFVYTTELRRQFSITFMTKKTSKTQPWKLLLQDSLVSWNLGLTMATQTSPRTILCGRRARKQRPRPHSYTLGAFCMRNQTPVVDDLLLMWRHG